MKAKAVEDQVGTFDIAELLVLAVFGDGAPIEEAITEETDAVALVIKAQQEMAASNEEYPVAIIEEMIMMEKTSVVKEFHPEAEGVVVVETPEVMEREDVTPPQSNEEIIAHEAVVEEIVDTEQNVVVEAHQEELHPEAQGIVVVETPEVVEREDITPPQSIEEMIAHEAVVEEVSATEQTVIVEGQQAEVHPEVDTGVVGIETPEVTEEKPSVIEPEVYVAEEAVVIMDENKK